MTIITFNLSYLPVKSQLLGMSLVSVLKTPTFANGWSQIERIRVIFTHLKLCVAVLTTSSG